ncbi:MAG: BamA/TamA family outer membrane protein [Candidatus Eremiobacteraeota bacterium]|nr:BamA/TamA family outer membrane protein [Candidatus Eremiobacteraeota bacterium]MBC5822311.1 BamA/TamA family outer membrane protein [Candidatus Eremiobacteraeota bacterium]
MMFRVRRASRCIAALIAFLALIVPFATPAGAGSRLAQAPPSGPATPAPNAPTVVSVDVSGNAHVPTATILSVVRTKPGQPFDEATVRADLQSIFELGYFGDQVPPLIRQRPGGIAITFRVVENPVITRIAFTGNEHVPTDTLLALMDTAVGQVLNTNTFHQDVLKINSYYDKIGYGGQVPTHVIGLNISKDGVLALNVREGLTVRSIVITGNPILPQPLIKKSLTLKEGQPYSEDARDKDYEALKKLYDKYDLSLGDFEAGIDPTTIDQQKGTADVKYSIYVATVGAVQITGNTVTKDVVIRRQLRLRPGMIITQGLVRRDYERLNNLGFFEKVDIQQKPGPDPKKPYALTLDWNVKEQRTGTAQIGAGYSGGPTGQGLTGTLSYSQNNINGTGNGASIRLERGSRVSDGELSFSVPYLGNTRLSQLYSVNATVFTSAQTNYYQVYQASQTQAVGSNPVVSTPSPSGPGTPSSGQVTGTIPVVLTPNQNLLGGAANYGNRSTGISANLGRRLTDTLTTTAGVSVQRLSTVVTFNNPAYFLAGTQQVFNQPLNNNLFGNEQNGTTLGVNATSIADTSNGAGYNLRSFTLGLQHDSRDDIINPRRGDSTALTEELSGRAVGSQFHYTITTLDAAKFYPVLKNATLGFHALLGNTTGAIPPSRLFVLTDQQLRGYSQVFYGTQEVLLQSELRVPVSPDRKFGLAFFFDYGGQRIRGAQPITDQFGNVVVDYNKFLYRTDGGVGLRFDIPQLGFKSIRLDFARGKGGSHTSFGIGQSF